MTDAELAAIIEAGTDASTVRFATGYPFYGTVVTLPESLVKNLVRAARELRELRRDATSRDGAR